MNAKEQSQPTRRSEMTKEKADKYFQDIKDATYKAWVKDEEFPSVIFVIQEKAGSRILGKASSFDMLMAFRNMFLEAFRLNPENGAKFLLSLTEDIEQMGLVRS